LVDPLITVCEIYGVIAAVRVDLPSLQPRGMGLLVISRQGINGPQIGRR